MFFGHFAASFAVAADVVFFKDDLLSLEEHPHQFAGEAAGLGEEQYTHGRHLLHHFDL